MGKYYGVRQMSYGADHVFVYNESQIRDAVREYGQCTAENLTAGNLPEIPEEEVCISETWPISGSNNACSVMVLLPREEDVVNYLKGPAFGPDSDDPLLIDMSGYYYAIETDEGCAGEILDRYGLDKCKIEAEAEEDFRKKYDAVIEFGIDPSGDASHMRMSEFEALRFIKGSIASMDPDSIAEGGPDNKARIAMPDPEGILRGILVSGEQQAYLEAWKQGESISYRFMAKDGGNWRPVSLKVDSPETGPAIDKMIKSFILDKWKSRTASEQKEE